MRATILIAFLTLTACPRNLGPSGPADSYNEQCVVLMHQGDLVQAEIACEHSLEFKPDHAEGLNNLGLIFQMRADLKKAKELFIRAIRANPDMAQAYNNLGVI